MGSTEPKLEWFYLPYKLGKYGNASLFKEGDITYLGNEASYYWFSNSQYCEYGIHGQLSMIDAAKGKVLCCLGMGILALLCALKDDVTEVVAVEIDKDIIAAFMDQGFNLDKISIVNSDIMELQNIDDFDSFLIDVTPTQYDFFDKHKNKLINKNVVLQGWENTYFNWLKNNFYGVHSLENFYKFADLWCMPKFSEAELNTYIFDYYAKVINAQKSFIGSEKFIDYLKSTNVPINEKVLNGLKEINLKRNIA
jgi:hypothetical protein